ncbi:MAG: DUF3641 domain-containing protein [Gammaproteobacteria bacterium]
MHETLHLLEKSDFPKITRSKVETLQVNLGYQCNQSCTHCHVDAGPNRKEMMTADNINVVIDYIKVQDIRVLDLTGGAPELHTRFKDLVKIAHSSVMCRAMISVDWQGYVYDCDFNQMLGMSLPHNNRIRTHLSEIMDADLEKNEIAIADHCYACTAGQGSSCGGALT